MSVSFCLPHPVAVIALMICRGLCACTEMLWMCVLYVSFASKVRPITFGYMPSALLCFRSRVWREQSASCFIWVYYDFALFCPGKNFLWVWLYTFLGCTRACVCGCDGDVICVGYELNRCTEWW